MPEEAKIIPFPGTEAGSTLDPEGERAGLVEHWEQLRFFGDPVPLPTVVKTTVDEDEYLVDEGITLAKSDDGAQLILSGFGLFVGKKSERLLVRKDKKVIYEFPFFRLQEVILASHGISISSDLIEELCERGIRLTLLGGAGGKPYAMLTSPMLSATNLARREQILAYSDQRGFLFSKLVVMGKIRNQEKLLRYFGKHIKTVDQEKFARIDALANQIKETRRKTREISGAQVDEARSTLMGLEGVAGKLYWDAVKLIIGQRVQFFGREHRGATDAVNSLLNYGYGILYSQVWGAVLNAGLEPFSGFLHVDRPGKPSLVLDLVEEFRQPVVDRTVISHINLGEAINLRDGMLDSDTRKRFAQKVLERLHTTEMIKGKKYQIRSIIQMQARRLCAFLRGEGAYQPFTFKW